MLIALGWACKYVPEFFIPINNRFIFISVVKIRLVEIAKQTVVGLLNSACDGLHQYVIINSWLFKTQRLWESN